MTVTDDQPSQRDIKLLRSALAPWTKLFKPRWFGLDNVPREGAVLLVGNHSVLAFVDMPVMFLELERKTGRFPRGLADRLHFGIPGWRDLLTRMGAVEGTRDACREMLAAGEAVLVYPGGAREVAKRKNEKYQLIWKQRTGFARMAIEAGCPIVPFAAVGAEDSLDVVVDADSALYTPVKKIVERFGGRWDAAWPIVRGIGPTPLPRPQTLYFAFGEAIETAGFTDDDHDVRVVRDRTKHAVEELIQTLLEQQAADRTG
ncbi:lysophospholipid acyltransferase family protein [Antrihabitans sp. YC2-6]|uniref:lysophospholipid acyltransferase family protein n=1 Tax=Antrihabitans sp. YC2-6 TaxID=2799498 RepID=UPI0018F7880A|nr:lysophospholipid acyltransferase family protein [Antrihabitans sp. YC2-6]MBJ8346736.1 acyltransferase family protein [Antrihabitans sp. YC2-6]